MGSAIFGVIFIAVIGAFAVRSTSSESGVYLNVLGMALVLGGTAAAAAISYNVKDLARMAFTILRVFKSPIADPRRVVVEIVAIATDMQARRPIMGTGRPMHPFLGDGLRLLENQLDAADIERIMKTAIVERHQQLNGEIAIVKALAKYPPAFGMIGTVLGLVALMAGLGSDDSHKLVGAHMAIALVATLYGLLLANIVFLPIVDNLTGRLQSDVRVRRIILKGTLLLAQRQDPILVQESLNAYLMPGKRLAAQGDGSPSQSDRMVA